MNIEKIENGFTNIIDIGKYSVFVYTKKDGVSVKFDDIYEQAQYYNSVVITGDECLLQREEVCKLLKKLVNTNNNIQIQLHTNGLFTPLYFNDYKDNIVCYIYINLNNKKQLNEQISTLSLKFYIDIHSKFIFIINDKEQLNEVENVVNIFSIKRKDVYIKLLNNTKENIEEIKYRKYNIAIEVEW